MPISKIGDRASHIAITKIIAALHTDIKKLAAYRLDLIDDKGTIIKQPKSSLERKALNREVRFALALKPFLYTNRIMRDQDDLKLKRQHSIIASYDAAIDAAMMSESNDTISILELINAMTADTEKAINAQVEEIEDEKLDKKVSKKYLLLGSKKRRKAFVKSALGIDDCFASPTVGTSDE